MQLPFGLSGFGIAIATIAMMISISGICLGVGYALDEKRLKEFGKTELYQSVVNGVLVGSLLVVFANNGIMTLLISSLTSSAISSYSCPAYMGQNSAICFSYSYLIGLEGYSIGNNSYSSLFSTISSLILGFLSLNTILGVIAGLKINLLLFTLSFSSILSPILVQIQYLLGILSTLAIGISVQAAVLSFVCVSAISTILPAGLILRSFYPSRKLGGFLIAISLGTYIVLPLSYVLNAIMINSYSATNSSSLSLVTMQASSLKDQIANSNLSYNQTSQSVLASFTSALDGIVHSVDQAISDMLFGISKLIMQIFILPAFSLVITGISIRELSELFGSEAAFGRFKMLG